MGFLQVGLWRGQS